ncbi:uncharacterized protein LOC128554860 [Mercenaria mercenaria]|uniref:uncharacterized protein LOC128554860 n=1 Tax=Mercenaria mercenaria TaxID=6596 RepID=UPI00234F24F6|nr:uncharacterized protein LOC128554860 [Mercenaria mercenaria]
MCSSARDHGHNQDEAKSAHSINKMNSEVSVSTIDIAFQKLASTLQEGSNLPKPELLTFSGKPTEYCKFIKNFETNIESKVTDDRLRLSYLIQYCYGEAKCCIEDCVLLEPSEGYRRARDILFSRYGRPHVIARTYIEKLVYGPQIAASDTDGLSKLALEMQRCEITLSQLGYNSDVDNSENLRRIVKRLPMHLRVKWVDTAHVINESGREVHFTDLVKFVDEKSRVASSMYGIDLIKENRTAKSTSCKPHGTKPVKDVTTLTTHSNTDQRRNERKCRCCHGNCLDVSVCSKFKSMSLNERKELVRKFKLCYNCLKGNHSSSNCRKPKSCTVPGCELKHNMLLHSWSRPNHESSASQAVTCASVKNSNVKNCLGIIPVIVNAKNGNSCQTYALLDDGADKTLCDERLLQSLNVTSKPVTFNISTVNSTSSTIHGQEIDLIALAVDENRNEEVPLSKVWSVKELPISTRSAAVNVDLKKLPYLSDIDIPQIDTNNVMLLIGTDSPAAHIPLEVRSGNIDQPYAVRSRLGWAVRGPVQDTCAPYTVNVHFEQSRDVLLQQQLERMWNTEFNDRSLNEKYSMPVEDKHALQIMELSLTHEDGHYKIGLPWRKENASLPNNIALAQVRLQQLKRKLSRDPELHKMYTTSLNDYVEKGYAEEVKDGLENISRRTWYLPHHPVTNVNKPGKVRVVFDCAAKYHGISLNSQLLQGPDLMNSLVGVLIRFWKEKVALAADIEAMFHQVRVTEEDCDALRFLWWPGGDITQQPKCYRMKVHLFGATSSPSCAAYALKRTATDNARLFGKEVVSTVERDFYVDDCLKSVETDDKAIKLATDLQTLMKLGGFRLTKWLSNSRAVLNAIPESELAPSVVNLSLDETLPCNRALGVQWNVNDDRIQIKVKLSDKPLTRRGILSVVSSIYDPLGLVSPVTLQAKAIIQSLCRLKIGWDDQIPQSINNEWHTWLSTLPCLENVSVNRCFRPSDCVKSTELHIFSDGSETAYGACAYLRFVDTYDNVTCSLVIGKSRLARSNRCLYHVLSYPELLSLAVFMRCCPMN